MTKVKFNLNYWLEHKEDVMLVTRCGYPVEILTHERKTTTQEGRSIVALVQNENDNQLVETYNPNGKKSEMSINKFDIFMEVKGELEKPKMTDWFG